MAEMKGYDYKTVFETMNKISIEKDVDLDREGILPNELLLFFKDYCQIGLVYNDPSNVSSYIDKGIPVAAVTCTTPYHMVTIIGYDRNNYYTAAGNGEGNATIYSKDQLNCCDYLYIFNKTKIPNK